MQKALTRIIRHSLLYLLLNALSAPGFSIKRVLSKVVLRQASIPDHQRVTTLYNLRNGLGVVRPISASPAAAVQAPGSAPFSEGGPGGPGAVAPAGAPPSPAGFPGPPQPDGEWQRVPRGSAPPGAPRLPPGAPLPPPGAPLPGSRPGGDIGPRGPPPGGPRRWEVEAIVEMMSSAPTLVQEYSASISGFALTLADRLHWATGVPLSRFMFYIPDPAMPTQTYSCSCSNFLAAMRSEETRGAVTERFGVSENSTYRCVRMARPYRLNRTAIRERPGALLQSMKSVRWEVGLYPATHILGDQMTGHQVGEQIIGLARDDAEPKRHLLKTGLWTYEPSPAVKFLGLFPATSAAWPGEPFIEGKDTALPLGPNPGGHGAVRSTTLSPEVMRAKEEAEEEREAGYFHHVDSVVQQADKINTEVKNSVEDLMASLTRASSAHAAWLNIKPYTIPPDLHY